MRRLLAAPVELEIKTNTSYPLPHGILSCLKLTRKEILFGLFWRIPGDCLNGVLVKSLECMQQSCCFHSDFEVQTKHSRLLISYHFSIFIKQWVHLVWCVWLWACIVWIPSHTHAHTLVQLILQLHLHLAKFTRKSREGFISVPGQWMQMMELKFTNNRTTGKSSLLHWSFGRSLNFELVSVVAKALNYRPCWPKGHWAPLGPWQEAVHSLMGRAASFVLELTLV